jgi:hypothetical protein
VRRDLALCFALYVPHLAEEALTRMHDDPIVVTAFEPLSGLSSRHAAYLVFQVMLVLAIGMTLVFSLGGRARLAVMVGLGLAFVAESHHALRAARGLAYNPGLFTSLPMPIVGAYVLGRVARAWPGLSATRTTLRLDAGPS